MQASSGTNRSGGSDNVILVVDGESEIKLKVIEQVDLALEDEPEVKKKKEVEENEGDKDEGKEGERTR